MKMGRPTKAQRNAIEERRTKAIRLRAAGEPWESIAADCGYGSAGAACQDVARALKARLAEQKLAVEEYRAVELERLDAMEREVWAVLHRRHYALSGGKIVYTPAGDGQESQPLEDDGPVLAAVDRLSRISERRAKLLGLDSPVKVEQGGAVRWEIVGVDIDKLT